MFEGKGWNDNGCKNGANECIKNISNLKHK